MAQSRILVEREALESAITDFQGKKAIMENSCQKLNQAVSELGSTYKGEASEAFQARFQEMYQNLSKASTAMEEEIGKIKYAVENYSSFEEAVKALIEAIVEGVSYLA